MLTMVMTSLSVPPLSAKLQQQQNEKEVLYTKVVKKNRPPTCSLDLLDDDEQVNTMVSYATTNCPTIDEEDENNNLLIHLGKKTRIDIGWLYLATSISLPLSHAKCTRLAISAKINFGPLLNVNMVFNGQLIHHFLLKQIPKEANADGICFSVLGKNVCFTQKEFNIMTGLWPTNTKLRKDYDNKCLQSLLFGSENKKIITCLEIEEIFKNFEFTNDHDAVKVALAVFIETVMVGKDKKTQFDMDILGRVDDDETVVKPKLKLSTQEKAFMESQIRGDDNTQMEDNESILDINNSDTNSPDHVMNNQSLEQSDSSSQLSPQRKQSQTMADQSEMHPITNKKRCRSKKSNDKEQQSHSKSYKKLKNEIKEVRKDLSTPTSIVSRMDDTIRKQSLELFEMKQMLERLVQVKFVFRKEHQEESGSDISIDGRDADLLLTIRDISDNLNAQSQKEKDLPEMITTLPLVSQPLPLSVGDFQEKLGCGDVNYMISCINIREHWLAIAADVRKYKIYVFDSMQNYLEKKLVDQALEMPARCTPHSQLKLEWTFIQNDSNMALGQYSNRIPHYRKGVR
ncbi:Ulp1-like peptidase [Cucumis melo var. makuwa]|uniref:Ulp1-like peptidase n=1 Tax=Cucumis melo var. makuwa TaxID=1194695 RepID=A0A5A7U3E7_CUCMM|nr:Ulp1-like peptidase [Cucumis melo var. makuwa]